MRTALKLCLAGALAAVAGCGPSPSQEPREDVAPIASRISDAAHHGGRAGFFFLPPIAGFTRYGSQFSPGLSPVVQIEEVGGRGIVATFTRTSGPGGAKVREAPQSYYVIWNARSSMVKAGFVYRIRVLLDGAELGYADAKVVTTFEGIFDAYEQEYTPLVGLPLLVAFRIEPAALSGCPFAPGEWVAVPPMPEALIQAVRLHSGKVLAFGGYGPTPLAVIFDPKTCQWSRTGSMTSPRAYASGTVLASGKVLVAGGGWGDADIGRTAELYDPDTGLWTPTGSMADDRSGHSATLLPSGKVLVAGGTTPATQYTGIRSAEIFDPATGTWSMTGEMAQGRGSPSAILLESGLVLVAGAYESQGADPASCELYDPATGAWRATGARPSSWPVGHFVLLDSGQVLRLEDSWATNIEAGTELYDPVTETWERRAPMPSTKGYYGVALLPSGRVLVAGGLPSTYPNDGPVAEADLYDPVTDSWSATAPLGTARHSLTTVTLADGGVLALGGDTVDAFNTTIAEVYREAP